MNIIPTIMMGIGPGQQAREIEIDKSGRMHCGGPEAS